MRAWAALERDDLPTAVREGQHAIQLAATAAPGLACWLAPIVLAETHLAAGAPDSARAELLHVSVDQLERVPTIHQVRRLRLLAEADVALGHLSDAREHARHAERTARACEPVEARAGADWAGATLALAQDQPTKAAEQALEAGTRLASVGLVIDAAKARILAARALTAAGAVEQAKRTLETVSADASRCGALRLARIAQHDHSRETRAATGPPTPAPTAEPLTLLTQREREITAHIARGETNRQIAGRVQPVDATP